MAIKIVSGILNKRLDTRNKILASCDFSKPDSFSHRTPFAVDESGNSQISHFL